MKECKTAVARIPAYLATKKVFIIDTGLNEKLRGLKEANNEYSFSVST